MQRTHILLILALVFGLALHGSAIFFTLEETYDAYVHLFFAEHYASNWFEHWNYKWYTGFTVHGYPPLVHQLLALISLVGGLKFALYTIAFLSIILFITGVYRYSLMLSGKEIIAGCTALLAVLSTSFIETLHLFGQLPSIVGLGLLLHALPEIYLWIRKGFKMQLITALCLLAIMVCSHHVTPIFGMVFFVFPVIGLAIMDNAKDQTGDWKKVKFRIFFNEFRKVFWRILGFGTTSLALIIICILPYWINSRVNPITQVPIPHGSRDNFLEMASSGLVFFLIPWGVLLFIMPFLFYRFFNKRYIFFGLSLALLTILGTGGTTPIPKIILGENAFNILTLDRFTLWATILVLPLFGEFAYRFLKGDIKERILQSSGSMVLRIQGFLLAGVFLFMIVLTMSLGYFRPAQPEKINMLPIVNFLNQDQHDRWRYLTLGFGDQMAWLSAQTEAKTVDGNYHSARRLPELTSRAIERLENSKYKGIEGIGSLQQFLTTPEKYHLKYIFSNDKFYDPILFYCGWQRLNQLENGVAVWERLNVSPLPTLLPREEVPGILRRMWGIIPVTTVLVALILIGYRIMKRSRKETKSFLAVYEQAASAYKMSSKMLLYLQIWILLIFVLALYGIYSFYVENADQYSPENVVQAYYDAIDFKEFEQAHSYMDPDANVSLDRFMLQISTTDGLLNSYAKLDRIGVKILNQIDNKAVAQVYTKWVTPLESIEKEYDHLLVRKKGDWFIVPDAVDTDIPPDQLFTENQVAYFNQGRRQISSQQTHYDDILEQPLLRVISSKLVRLGGQYSIIGEIQNIDNVPADVMIRATLYDESGAELAEYDARYLLKHKLMPRETTVFRVDFEDVAWQDASEAIPSSYEPEQFTPAKLEAAPRYFNLQCAGNITNKDLFKKVALQQLKIDGKRMQGTLFNSGIQEITVPQLLVSYYGKDQELLWVDHQFLQEGIRVQRKKKFQYPLLELSDLEVLNEDMSLNFVNGLPNPVGNSNEQANYKEHMNRLLQPCQNDGYDFVKIDLNAYVGNPK
ncbi:MAG: hypothetical protein KJO04_01290 [Bacteroidia bacterium]|nr:hypothetical protein [Bacteroidia bacterium]